jgi:hypothetical protein
MTRQVSRDRPRIISFFPPKGASVGSFIHFWRSCQHTREGVTFAEFTVADGGE